MRKLREQAPDAIGGPVDRAVSKSGLGRPTLYQLMDAGKLRYIKIGRRRIITDEALLECLRQLEAETAGRAA